MNVINQKSICKVFISDIHFGKSKNNLIGENIISFINELPNPEVVDYIIISGDTYDKLQSLNSDGSKDALITLIYIAKFCIKYDIKFRVLEGTPSHDRKQIEMFEIIANTTMLDLDFRYITQIEIILEDDGHSCLYIPDEITFSTRETFRQVLELMKSMNLDTIDSCVMHGGYKHNMKFGDDDTLHIEEDYLSICTGYIITGHIHKHQIFGRIITPGSFDRLGFGQEENKGGILTFENITNPSVNTFFFLRNEKAMTFIDIQVKSITLEELVKEVSSIIHNLRLGSHVRLVFEDDNPMYLSDEIIKSFSDFNLVSHIIKQKEVELDNDNPRTKNMFMNEHIEITPNNIAKLVSEKIRTRNVDMTNEEIIDIVSYIRGEDYSRKGETV